MRYLLVSALAVAAATLGEPLSAQENYPTRPVVLVVPVAPGGSTDVMGRLLAQAMSSELGVNIVIENRAGGGTNIGAAYVAQSKPDGYTLLMNSAAQAIGMSLYPKLPYDLQKDLVAVAPVAASPSVLVIHPSIPARTLAEFIALAKAKPGDFSYASAGNGTTGHLAAELFKIKAGIDMVHVPYKGAGPAMQDLMGGRVHLLFGFTSATIPAINAGHVRPLAVTVKERLKEMPELPTMEEGGVPEAEVEVWYGIAAPVGTPQPIVRRLNEVVGKAVTAVSDKLVQQGSYPLRSSPEEFSAFIGREVDKWGGVVRAARIRVD